MQSEIPIYKILSEKGFFAGEGVHCQLYREGDLVEFDGEPNEEMQPMNDSAKEALTAYFEKLDKLAHEVADKNGRPYVGRPKTLDDAVAIATSDARRVQLVSGDGGIPLMGGKGQGKVHIKSVPAQEESKSPSKIGRPRKEQSNG